MHISFRNIFPHIFSLLRFFLELDIAAKWRLAPSCGQSCNLLGSNSLDYMSLD